MKKIILMGLAAAVILSACSTGQQEEDKQEQTTENKINENELRFYIGTYTNGESKGIYRAYLYKDSGEIRLDTLVAEAGNPSFLALSPDRKYLYSVNEFPEREGEKAGGISAFLIEPETGDLELINNVKSGGGAPCYVSTEGSFVFAANYGGGSVLSCITRPSGELGNKVVIIKHEGSGPNTRRQSSPHAHAIVPGPDGKRVYAPDLGIDKILIYRVNQETGELSPNDPPFQQVEPGAGPRHFTFHPNGRFAYVINELNSTITAFNYNSGNGALEPFQTVTTLPDAFDGENYCADIHVHPTGRFLYGSNRGHDSIVGYRIDENTGELTMIGHASQDINWPRNFGIEPEGKFLLAANQNGNSIVSFRINQESGELAPVGSKMEIPSPVCITFYD